MTSINREIFFRIQLLKFPLMVCIVFRHSYVDNSLKITEIIENLVSLNVAETAVPLFFLFSGFLFFRNFKNLATYREKLTRRIRSLLIPYTFWNLSFLIFILLVQSLPNSESFISGRYEKPVLHYSFYDFLDAFLGLNTYPLMYQFWFIRDLMIAAILSPIFFFLAQRIPYLALISFAIPWFFKVNFQFFLQWDSLLFFYGGCLIAVKQWDLSRVDRHRKLIFGLYLPLLIVSTGLTVAKVDGFSFQLHKLTILVGILFFWCASALVNAKGQTLLIKLSAFSFFVYAAHEPTLTLLKKLMRRILSGSELTVELLLYFLVPIVTIAITLVTGIFLRKYVPKFYQMITGGRGELASQVNS